MNEHQIAFPAHTYSNYLKFEYSSKLAVKLLMKSATGVPKQEKDVSQEESDN
jgi:hypothetical protein